MMQNRFLQTIGGTRGFLCGLLCLTGVACQQNTGTQNNTATQQESQLKATSQAGTQVVMKVQPHTYDDKQKTLISGDYADKQKIEVPPALSGQNKWFMFEGPVLENDKVAYRYYADKRHRFDIYGKKVSDLVMDTVSWDYHNIMDWGSDILKVGNSVGIGSPAILYQDSIYCLDTWDKKEIAVMSSGGSTSSIRTTFYGLTVGDQSMTIQQDWHLSTGDYHSTIELKRLDGDLPDNMRFATGIVKHLDDFTLETRDGKSVGYNWGKQSFHKQNLGMGIISDLDSGPRLHADKLSHVIVYDNSRTGVKYHFLSVWADGIGGIDTKEKFITEIGRSVQTLSKE